ncbi:signal peptidase II [Marivirga sp. S37H4]|uniref:Lipoprotein signal peptidase n=1 Tax=Marivirga aurantiaca TaxID=2802615 RepID=A0A935C8V2_9BACT|nr:signal peptidase II [Marivirga aurantiaca]MBK6263908.1 signal peptidase II [Marivirga aurantiaca]
MKFNLFTKTLFALIIILSNVACDQITKVKVRKEISLNEVISVINDNFVLTKVENTGAALSLGKDLSPTLKVVFLQIMPLLVLFFLFKVIVSRKDTSRLNVIAFSFIIGGGIGNIYDRILYNSVTDFMYIKVGAFHTGIFNMADVSVVIGTVLIVVNTLITETRKYRLG